MAGGAITVAEKTIAVITKALEKAGIYCREWWRRKVEAVTVRWLVGQVPVGACGESV
jgi:hypothetical protein